MQKKIQKQSEADLTSDFPIKSEVKGWYFKIVETSGGAYTIEGKDVWGRKIALQGSNPDELLTKANSEAIKINIQS